MTIDRTRLPDDDRTTVVERTTETRVDEHRPAAPYVAAPQTNVNAAPVAHPVWTLTRVVTLIFTVLEVLLLFRFLLKLFGANQTQPLVAALYGVTDPLVRPFEGIFAIPPDSPFDVAALLAIVFLFLVAALIVALVKAIAGRTA
ncbi:MAG TPA: YggT family protein [Candidatus Limnocylindria bacterium]|nr:YggT family protein [Candidatus Limnocylindria bacterium]